MLSASPSRLVVLVYDHLLGSLGKARYAIVSQQPEARIEALTKAREAVSELLATLDHARGGEIAAQLASLYTFFLSELADIGANPRPEALDRLIAMVGELREAFAKVDVGGAAA